MTSTGGDAIYWGDATSTAAIRYGDVGRASGMDGALLPLAVGNSSIDIISSAAEN